MKSKDARNEAPEPRSSPIQVHVEITSAHQRRRHEEIRLRAYEIYLERGGLPGNELDDWLLAERELERTAQRMSQELSNKAEHK